ncbi:MAG: hypothetical protein J5U17_07030 [Candidatus Methanoperedens sp.]|nr:hypothetical protein [Candidatus Methanoperedens sp.]MCE8429021.1 hypothetical protein [Candidatus Methanoperedens sp.]
MVENIGKIINNGFETYMKNINLSIPFVINIFATGILAVMFGVFGLLYIFGSSLSSLENITAPEQVLFFISSRIVPHVTEIVFIFILMFISITFINSFFISGAIGMAKQATETGKSELSTMTEAGKRNFLNMFLGQILVDLLTLAGMIFIVPGAMKLDFTNLLASKNGPAAALFWVGLLFWILYAVILSLVLVIFKYALVIDGLDPTESITTGFKFFNQHKGDVFVLWLIIGVFLFVLTILDMVLGQVPILNILWPFVNLFISVLVIPPITTIWWVRLYMTRTDKKIYFNDLLVHPNDIPIVNQ